MTHPEHKLGPELDFSQLPGKQRYVAFSPGLASNWVDERVQLWVSEPCE